jgi:hypothetical protein
MQPNIIPERFTFQSENTTIVGNLFLPAEKPVGVVVATGPLTSVKEQAAGAYAHAMAERGFAALAFDFRFFGESDGQPRQFESPEQNKKDIKNAISALSADPRFKDLPVFAIGICFGAGPMVVTVSDEPRFSAFAGVAGVYTSVEKTKQMMGDAFDQAIQRGKEAEQKYKETGEAETIPAVAPDGGDVAMPLREAYDFYGTPRGAVPNYTNGFAVQSFAYTVPFDAMGVAPKLKVPVLIVHSEKALLPDLAHQFYADVTSQKQELWLNSQGQIDFYDDPNLINPAADAIKAFFLKAVEA